MTRSQLPCILLLCCALGLSNLAAEQKLAISPRLLANQWEASWIACPGVSRRDYGVFHFRKTISLSSKPARFIVHASADNRYKLYVNGVLAGEGPSRGDLRGP